MPLEMLDCDAASTNLFTYIDGPAGLSSLPGTSPSRAASPSDSVFSALRSIAC
jgi:hypothetical protein